MKNNEDKKIHGAEEIVSSEMSNVKPEDEITKTESVGLESDSFVNATVPRECAGSDVFETNLIQVATIEDPPLDDPILPFMTSKTSTWDPNFPTVVDVLSTEQTVTNCPTNSYDLSSVSFINNNEDSNCREEKISSFITDFESSSGDSQRNIETPQINGELVLVAEKVTECLGLFPADVQLSDHDISPEVQDEDLFNVKSRENELANVKSNCFIDAASLLDDNEVTTFAPNVLSYSCHELDHTKFVSLPFFPTEEKYSSDCQAPESGKLNVGEACFEKTNNQNSNREDEDFKARRSSFIRRNTFELELDDERLEILRNEYERHKDKVDQNNKISSQNMVDQDKSPSTVKEIESFDNTSDITPNIPTDLKFSQKYEEDMHSPDSLNNEPIESSHNKGLEPCRTSYSLPFELNYRNGQYENDYAYNDIDHRNHKTNDSNEFSYQDDEEMENCFNVKERLPTGDIPSMKSKQHMQEIESAPIVSGGVSLKDLSPPAKQMSSPLANRRKTECAPIISGGSVVEIDSVKEPKTRLKTPFSESWTIDMTEIGQASAGDNEPNEGLLNCDGKRDEQHVSPKSKNSSLGFFISLDNPYEEKSLIDSGYKSSSCRTNKDGDKIKDESKGKYYSSDSNTSSASCGFYLDLNNAHECSSNSVENDENNVQPVSEKKLFSMFVDIGKNSESDDIKSNSSSPHISKRSKQPKMPPGPFSSRFNEKQKFVDSQMSSESSLDLTESSEFSNKFIETKQPKNENTTDIKNLPLQVNDKKQSFYMFIEAEHSTFFHRKSLPSGLVPATQRHSWNSESHNMAPVSKDASKRSNVQSHDVFVNKSLDVMFNVNKEEKQHNIPSQVNISNSLDHNAGPTSIDELILKNSKKHRHWSSKSNKDSQKGSLKSELNSLKENKSDSVTFHKSDNSCKMTDSLEKNADSSFISITSNDSSISDIHNSTFIIGDASNDDNATNNDLELSTPTCDIVRQFSNDDINKPEADEEVLGKTSDFPITPDHSISQNTVPDNDQDSFSFVKLSDMDKEPTKLHVEEKQVVNRMSRSIPGASWIETKLMTRSATSRSLTRLFPHLNASAHNLTQDPSDYDNEYSEMSSMQSSMDPSALEGSTEDTEGSSCAGKPVSRLGEDLLRMFLDEISPDVTVEVGGRRIKAHKCILSSRCQYFAAILSGGWVESAGNVISLQGFSYNAVHFALCHIYSGASNIPDSINIVELATLADMLCLEGLKEVIVYTLKVKYCHFFHKPCPLCTVGVLECLPLAAAYGLDEIYRKSLRWITKHFVRVWPTKGFASLPRELLDKCYKQHIIHMSVDTVLETALACTKLQDVIPIVRWAEPVISLTNKLYEAIVKYMALHFCEVLLADMLLSLGKQKLWSMSGVEEILLSAAEKLPPDQACKSYSQLHKLIEYVDLPTATNSTDLNEDFVKFLRKLLTTVEGCLLKQASRASRTPAWTLMEPQLRHKIQDASCLVIVPGDDRRRARHLLKKGESTNINRPINQQAKSTAPDVPQGKKVTQTKSLNITKQRAGQAASNTETSGPRPKTWPCRLSEVKSRYLEQKPTPKQSPALSNTKPEKTSLAPAGRRNVSKSIISSSDSSRTSSPAMKRPLAQRPSRSLPNKDNYVSRKKESLSLSNESPTDASTSASKQKGEANTFKKNQSLSQIDFIDRNMRFLSVKSVNAKRTTRENLASAAISHSKDKTQLMKMESDKNKYLKNSSQNSPHLKDSPLSQTRSSFNSTPPSACKNTPSPKPKSVTESKTAVLKRTSTYRVNSKSSNPSNTTVTKSRETNVGSPTVKGNINKFQSKESSSKKCTTNNNVVSNNGGKSETKMQPMVGSRSGTFLKDEPTVLKKPTVMNVSE